MIPCTEQYKKINAVRGILYGLYKVHKAITDICPPFRPILSAIGTFSYKLAKFLVPKLSSITFNEFTVKYSFAFAEEMYTRTVIFSWVASMLTCCLLIHLLKRPLIFVVICFIIMRIL